MVANNSWFTERMASMFENITVTVDPASRPPTRIGSRNSCRGCGQGRGMQGTHADNGSELGYVRVFSIKYFSHYSLPVATTSTCTEVITTIVIYNTLP